MAGLVVGALFALGAGCPQEAGTTSSSIVLTTAEDRVIVASPDDSAVVELDAVTLGEVRRVSVPGAPTQLLLVEGGLWAALDAAPAVAFVDLEAGRVREVSLPCGRSRHLLAVPGGELWASCPDDGRVVQIAGAAGEEAVTRVLGGLGRPAALGWSPDRLEVADDATGEILSWAWAELAALPASASPADVAATAQRTSLLDEGPGVAASQVAGAAWDAAAGRNVYVFQRLAHDDDRGRPAEEGGYGSVIDGDPRIEPRLVGACAERYARFDGSERVMSLPSALVVSSSTRMVWVAHLATDTLAALDCASPDGELAPLFASFATGRGPVGVAVSDDGHTAWVDNAFDHSVSRFELPEEPVRGAFVPPVAELARDLVEARFSPLALEGRSLFFDAVNTQLTPSGVVTCGTCHPAGQEDGLAWFLHTPGVPRKLRRTPPAWGARPALLPYHWDGEFTEGTTLSLTTIRELMEGEALLVDLDAIAAWLEEIPPPPPRPVPDAEAVARGQALFDDDAVGCRECHQGPWGSDGDRHAVLRPSADPDGALDEAGTPPLVGVRARGPWLHDGRATSLLGLFTEHNPDDEHGVTSILDDGDLQDLVLYLESW